MSTIINADTSDGLKFTSDTSGEIKLQSAGADIATVTSSGITMASGKTINAITEIDQWRLTADITANGDITSNLERVDHPTFAKIGTGMTESSGIFTFPSTGLYLVQLKIAVNTTGTDTVGLQTFVSTDTGSTYSALNYVQCGQVGTGALVNHASGIDFVNVTNALNFKVKFNVSSLTAGVVDGSTDVNLTTFTFIKLGDSQ